MIDQYTMVTPKYFIAAVLLYSNEPLGSMTGGEVLD
jgi:hypothetical protein